MSGSNSGIPPIPLRVDGADAFGRVLDEAGRAAERFAARTAASGQQLGTLSTVADNVGEKLGTLSSRAQAASVVLDRLGAGQAATALTTFGTVLDAVGTAAARVGGSAAAAEVGVSSFVARMAAGVTIVGTVAVGLQAMGLGIRAAGDAAVSAKTASEAYQQGLQTLSGILGTTEQRALATAQALFLVARNAGLARAESNIGVLMDRRSESMRLAELTQGQLTAAEQGLEQARGRLGSVSGLFGSRGSFSADVERREREVASLRARLAAQQTEYQRLTGEIDDLGRQRTLAEHVIYATPAGPDLPTGGGRSGGSGSAAPDPELMVGWNALQDQNRDREAADRREAADWDREQERREREAERAQERAIESNRRVTDRITDYTANTFADLFDKNGRGWEGMLDTFESTFTKMLARIAAEAVIRPVVEPIVSSLGLGALGTGNGGLSGLFGGVVSGGGSSVSRAPVGLQAGSGGGLGGLTNLGGGSGGGTGIGGSSTSSGGPGGLLGSVRGILDTPLWGGASSIADLPELPTADSIGGVVPSTGPSVGTYLASAGMGYMAGSTVGGFVAGKSKARQQNSQIGAGVGAAIGAIWGPVGALAGGAIGGAVGGMLGPSRQFSGGDVGVAVDANGFLTLGKVGGKRWDSGAATNQTTAQLEQINQMLRASGVTLNGLQGAQIGNQGYGGSKNVFGPTEIWAATRNNMTTSNRTLSAALAQPWMQSFEDLGVIAPYAMQNDNLTRAMGSGGIRSRDDFNNAATFITSIYEPLSKVTDKSTAFVDAIAAQNKVYDDAIAKARELGLAETGLVAAREKSLAETLDARNTEVHTRLTQLKTAELRAENTPASLRQAAGIEFSLNAGLGRRDLQAFLRDRGVGDETAMFKDALARYEKVVEADRKSLAEQMAEQQRAARDTLRGATTGLRIDELRSTGNTADARRAALMEFDFAGEQRRDSLLGTLKAAGFGADSERATTLLGRLNDLLASQRKTLNAASPGAAAGSSLLQELLFGDASGMTGAARYAAGRTVLDKYERAGNLDAYIGAAQRFLPSARDYLGTSERYGDMAADIRKTIARMGGDPDGLMQSINYQSRTADGVERLVSRQDVTNEEIKAMRAEIGRLSATMAAMMRRNAA